MRRDVLDIWYNAKFLLKFVICGHHEHFAWQNFRLLRYVCLMQDFTQICHFCPPQTSCVAQFFRLLQNFYSKLSFLTTMDMLHVKILYFSNTFASCKISLKFVIFDHHEHVGSQSVRFFRCLVQCKILTKVCHFWPPKTCCMSKFYICQILLLHAKFHSNLSFLTTMNMLGVKVSDFSDNWDNAKFLLKFVIFDHQGYVTYQNFIFFRYFCLMQDCTQICHFWPPQTCWMSKCQIFQINVKFVIFAHHRQVVWHNSSDYCKIFTQIYHFWPPWTCCMSKFYIFQILLLHAKFHSNLSFLTTMNMLGVKVSDFSDVWHNAKFLLKFVIFDHQGHVACQNFIFVKYFSFMQNFTQICHFWPPWTCWESKCQIFQIIGTMQNSY